VTLDDLIKHLEGELYSQDARIIDVISTRQPLLTVSTEDILSTAVEMTANHKVGSVLVTEKDNGVGIIRNLQNPIFSPIMRP
jgi:CBS domain-containing protein